MLSYSACILFSSYPSVLLLVISSGYPNSCNTNDLKVAGASLLVPFSDSGIMLAAAG